MCPDYNGLATSTLIYLDCNMKSTDCGKTWQIPTQCSDMSTSISQNNHCVGMSFADSLVFSLFRLLLPAGLPRSGKLPVLFLLTGQKSGFSPRRGDSLHRFRSNFAGPRGTWVRLAVQNFMSIGAEGWECGPQNIKNFHFTFW